MTRSESPKILPALMGALHQEGADGMLVLEQNDGCRRFYWSGGNLTFLQSDVAGEQFGNYLLRQGVLDFPALSELLSNEERFRIGEKVVQWGLMTVEERDQHLRTLQEQVMIHALEHPIVHLLWNPEGLKQVLSEDLRFQINHRLFVWKTFQEAHNREEICDLLYERKDWRWVAPSNLLDTLGDLPLNPATAYAMSFLGPEPVGFETFLSLSPGLDEEEAATLLMTLWALGALNLAKGEMPSFRREATPEPPSSPPPELPPTPVLPPMATPNLPPSPTPAEPLPELSLDFEPQIGFRSTSEPPDLVIEQEDELPTLLDKEAPEEGPATRARKLYLKAKSLLIQERVAEAIRLLEQSVKLDPESTAAYEPWLLLGRHRMNNPAWSSRAIEALQSASRLRPQAAEPWALMGEVYHRKGFKANATGCFRKALELDPSVAVPVPLEPEPEPSPQAGETTGFFERFKNLLGGKG